MSSQVLVIITSCTVSFKCTWCPCCYVSPAIEKCVPVSGFTSLSVSCHFVRIIGTIVLKAVVLSASCTAVFQNVIGNFTLLCFLVQACHPLMPEARMSNMVQQHLKGNVDEAIWKPIVHGICKKVLIPFTLLVCASICHIN